MYIPIIVLIGVAIGIVLAFRHGLRLEKDLGSTRSRLLAAENTLSKERKQTAIEKGTAEAQRKQLETSVEEMKRLLAEKSKAMPWIAGAMADLYWAQDERIAHYLETKKHPAATAAETVREHAREKKELRIKKRLTEYRIALYENLFPWLTDIAFDDAEEIAESHHRDVDDTDDPASAWLSQNEWASLPPIERYQRALDRYKKRHKSNWQIGREFERYVGYHWEKKGYDVEYYGAIKGFEDFGRDLIIKGKTGKFALIQCKYWAQYKTVPEAAVFQLLGSAVSFYIERNKKAPRDFAALLDFVQPYLYTSANLDAQILDIAKAMGIKVRDQMVMEDWPMVKCNMPTDGIGIYHLPMDQQYDRVKISKPTKCYVSTVAEAEGKGFRRAKRWFGDESDAPQTPNQPG